MTNFFSIGVEGFRFLTVTVDLWAFLGVLAIAAVLRFVLLRQKTLPFRSIKIDSLELGPGFPSVTIRLDRREQELAYALWVELGTRKAALPFDEKYDVIVEVYDSWYTFFGMARKIMREIPPGRTKGRNSLASVTEQVLNDGMRPHLTRWQAVFRRWYTQALDDPANVDKSPQEIQREFPDYEELVADIKRANVALTQYRGVLSEISGMK